MQKIHIDTIIKNTIFQDTEELPSMLKPGSNKLKESEAEIIKELHMFEEQEDKTLKNFEMETKKQEENNENSQEQKIEEVEQGIYM